MQNTEGAGGGFFDFEGGLRRVALDVEFFHAGVHDVCAQDVNQEKTDENEEGNSTEGAATVKPFGDQVRDGDSRAPKLNNEVAVDENLRGSSGVGPAQQAGHLIGKEGGRPGESEKDDRSHPHCGVQDSD